MSDAAPEPQSKPKRSFARRLAVLGIGVLMVALLVVAGLGFYVTTRPIKAPDWVQSRIEARIAEELPLARVTFGEMVFVMDEGWVPRVRLRDVAVSTTDSVEIVSFSEIKASFALRPLLEGVVQPREIALSGIFATLNRGADGSVSLTASSGTAAPARQAATLPQLIGQVDEILETPSLRGLSNVDIRALTLRYEDSRADRFWIVDGGRMRLTRDEDNLALSADLAVLSGGAGAATLAANYSSVIGDTAATFGVSFDGVPAQDIAAQGPAFAWLGVLQAPISGSVRSSLEPSGTFGPLYATLQIDAGAVQPNPQTQPIPFEGARSYFSYDPAEGLLRFDELSVQSKWVSGQASGTAMLTELGHGAGFGELVGQFSLREMTANPRDLYPEPIALAEADVDFQLKLDPFRVKLGRLQITDEGKTLHIDGNLEADSDGWHVAVDGRMDAITPDRLLALWPDRLIPKTRSWLVENLKQGKVENIDLALRLQPEERPHTYVAFDYREAEVKFMKNMPPITGGQGHFSLIDNRLVITVDEGGHRTSGRADRCARVIFYPAGCRGQGWRPGGDPAGDTVDGHGSFVADRRRPAKCHGKSEVAGHTGRWSSRSKRDSFAAVASGDRTKRYHLLF
ncbi:DUF3971 domain-containing protein [Sulfitobacter aestuariivivens]|uniref:YhdP family protein n=1 Tax=Sulfitobacter aestuariivivens TaxID=2766981 RepID=UPI003610AECF